MIDTSRTVGLRGVNAIVGTLAACGLSLAAHGGVETCSQVADQAGHGSTGTIGATSDTNPEADFVVADNFSTVTSGNITELTWWGIYLDFGDATAEPPIDAFDCGPNNPQFPQVETFTITYYESNNNGATAIPGTEIDSFQILGANLNKMATGNIVEAAGDLMLDEYQYTVTHDPVAVDANQCYWVEIHNTTSETCFWLWQTADGDGVSIQDADQNGYQTDETSDYDMAFCLNLDTDTDTSCSVANDDCDDAIVVSEGATPFTNLNATTDGFADSLCDFNGSMQVRSDVWYLYNAPCAGEYTFAVCVSDFNTKMAIYQFFCPGGGEEAIACSDDDCGLQTSITTTLSSAGNYYIRIGSPTGQQGTGTLSITAPVCVDPPSNDACGAAPFQVGEGSVAVDTTGATSVGPVEACGSIQADVWYRWGSTCGINTTISLSGARIAVYGSGCPAGPGALVCGDDSVCLDTEAGTIYRVRVGSSDGSPVIGSLSFACNPNPCGGGDPCVGDTNNDGAVNSDDLVNTILCFDTDGIADEDGGECDVLNAGDNADSVGGPSAGIVDSDDLVSGVILNWGDCP